MGFVGKCVLVCVGCECVVVRGMRVLCERERVVECEYICECMPAVSVRVCHSVCVKMNVSVALELREFV